MGTRGPGPYDLNVSGAESSSSVNDNLLSGCRQSDPEPKASSNSSCEADPDDDDLLPGFRSDLPISGGGSDSKETERPSLISVDSSPRPAEVDPFGWLASEPAMFSSTSFAPYADDLDPFNIPAPVSSILEDRLRTPSNGTKDGLEGLEDPDSGAEIHVASSIEELEEFACGRSHAGFDAGVKDSLEDEPRKAAVERAECWSSANDDLLAGFKESDPEPKASSCSSWQAEPDYGNDLLTGFRSEETQRSRPAEVDPPRPAEVDPFGGLASELNMFSLNTASAPYLDDLDPFNVPASVSFRQDGYVASSIEGFASHGGFNAGVEDSLHDPEAGDLESIFYTRPSSAPRQRPPPAPDLSETKIDDWTSLFATPSASNIDDWTFAAPSASEFQQVDTIDDWTSLFATPSASASEFQEVDGQQLALERAAKALADKKHRDLNEQRQQSEKDRVSESLNAEIKRWIAGKEGNLRALLSTLQCVLWPECGWQPVSLADLITAASVKKVYRKAALCVHPDKVQQKGATVEQSYIAEKVFDLLKEAWNKFKE